MIRTMSSREGEQERCGKGNEDPRRPITHEYAPAEQGFNRWQWDLRSEDVPCIDDILLNGGYNGPSVAPGEYTARLTLGDATTEATFSVVNDPRSFASDEEIADWVEALADVKELLSEVLLTLDEAREAREQIRYLTSQHDNARLKLLGEQAIAGIDAWEEKITQLKFETYEDEDAWPTMIDGQLRFLMDTIDDSGAPVTDGMRIRQSDLTGLWEELGGELDAITERYIAPINDWAGERQAPHIVVPGEAE